MLQVNALACRRGGREIFREVSFALGAGDILLVTGENGSGKSSLLRVLAGLIPSTVPALSWQGQNIEVEPSLYRRNLHYVGHQDAAKSEFTVAEMLDYWRSLYSLDRLEAPLAQDPFSIARLLDKSVRALSAGQKRRLALSRLTFNDAPLWLLDEPQTALDRDGQGILADLITQHRTKGGMAIIATHHDMNLPQAKHLEMKGRRS